MRNIFISSSPPSFTQSYGAGWKLWTFRVDIFSSFLSDSTSTYLLSTFYWYWELEGREEGIDLQYSHYFSSQLTISAHPVCGLTTLIRLHWTEKTFYQIFASRLIIYRPNRSRGHTKVLLKEWRMWGTTFNECQDSRPLNRSSISGGGDRRRSWRVVTSRDTAWRALQGVTQAYIYTPSSPGLPCWPNSPNSSLLNPISTQTAPIVKLLSVFILCK